MRDILEQWNGRLLRPRSMRPNSSVRLTQVQRDFVAFAAHELRTPAATVYGLAATLAGRPDLPPETVEELRVTLHAQADRMRRLVEQLLDLSRLDAASLHLSLERVALLDELEAVVTSVAPGQERDISVSAPHLFDRFRRSETSSRRKVGAGLGLSIARSYARAHGGELLFVPTGRPGARFELVLPAAARK